jgi:pyruvate dehydrogenase E2 component (dihydrolipoamide acetyltransferase)
MQMPIEIPMPKLGLTMEEGTVVEWLLAPADVVEKGQPLFVLETDKLTIEVEAPESGTLDEILVAAGETVPTGTPVGLLRAAGEEPIAPAEPQDKPADKPKVKSTPVARRLAGQSGLDIGGIQGTGRGGRVTAQDVEQALATAQEQETKASAQAPAAEEEEEAAPRPPATKPWRRVKASPRARELAATAGLDLATVEGTGKDGRVMARDVEQALATTPDRHVSSPEESDDQPLTGSPATVVPLSGVRGIIAQRMATSARTTAAVTTMTQADATGLVRLRTSLSQEWTARGSIAPTYNDLLLVILAHALGEHPYMNAHLIEDEIHQMASANIGLAVDTGRELVVPVVRDVPQMLLADVVRTTHDLVRRAQAGALLPDDLHGGTFTLSNLGAYDADHQPTRVCGSGRGPDRPTAGGVRRRALCAPDGHAEPELRPPGHRRRAGGPLSGSRQAAGRTTPPGFGAIGRQEVLAYGWRVWSRPPKRSQPMAPSGWRMMSTRPSLAGPSRISSRSSSHSAKAAGGGGG